MIFFLVVAASSSSSSSVGGPLISGETGDPGVVGYGAQHTSDPMEVERGDWDPLTLSQLLPGDDEVDIFSKMLVHHPESSSEPHASSSNSPVEVSGREAGYNQEAIGLVPAAPTYEKSDIKKWLEHSLQFIKNAIKGGLEATLVVDPKQRKSIGPTMACFYGVPDKMDKLNWLLHELDENDRNPWVKQISFIEVEIIPRIKGMKNAQKKIRQNRSIYKPKQEEKRQPFRNEQVKPAGEIKEKLGELEHS